MNEGALRRLLAWLEGKGFPRFYVVRPENFSWLTGGDSTVVVGEGAGWLEITDGRVILHTSSIERRRLPEEEAPGVDEVIAHPWYRLPQPGRPNDLEHDLTPLRLVLSPEEQEAFRDLGRDTARAVGEAMRAATPGWTERELAGAVAEGLYSLGIQPVVLLVAGERRVREYRHPLPKGEPLGGLCMVVVCGRRAGLVANLTRMRSWGEPPERIQEDYHKVLAVEAAALAFSRPGVTLDGVLSAIKGAYRKVGEEGAFEDHHQGGIAGHLPREILAVPGDQTSLEVGMAVAWNPSLPGVKVEDTFLITEEGLENLTLNPDWPVVKVDDRPRPDILRS